MTAELERPPPGDKKPASEAGSLRNGTTTNRQSTAAAPTTSSIELMLRDAGVPAPIVKIVIQWRRLQPGAHIGPTCSRMLGRMLREAAP